MERITAFIPALLLILVILIIWFVIRKILESLSDKINNSELYKEDLLNILEEIRDELKELNKNNSVK